MPISMSNILNKLSDRSWQTLSIGMAIAIGTSPIALTILLANSGSLKIKTPERQIDFEGRVKFVTSKSEEKIQKLQAQFNKLYFEYKKLARAAERTNDTSLNKQVEKLERQFIESGIRLNDVKESQQEIESLIESSQ